MTAAEGAAADRAAPTARRRAGSLVSRGGIVIPFVILFVDAQPRQPALPADRRT